jgi:membrane protease YdiL (CAAX protease family)
MTGGRSSGRFYTLGPEPRRTPFAPGAGRTPSPGVAGAARSSRRRIVAVSGLAGMGLLGLAFSRRPGSKEFYVLAGGVAGTLAAGTVLSGTRPPVRSQGQEPRQARTVVSSVLAGVGAFAIFCAAAHLARRVPWLERAVGRALAYEIEGSTPLVLLTTGLNGIAEEMFYRGALWSVVADSNPITKTTLAYTAATVATRNPALVLAGTATSLLFGYQRRVTGGILGPTITHLTWSMLMLRHLAPLFPHRLQD